MTDIGLNDTDTSLADLFESDAAYFEADAERIPVDGASIARMRGMETLAAGCVVHRVDPARVPSDTDGWLAALEERLSKVGCPRSRLYLQQSAPRLEAALSARGYRPIDEIALLMPPNSEAAAAAVDERVTLRPVERPAEWEAKLAIHRLARRGPDGHENEADLWVELERRKALAGYMTPHLICHDGEPAGVVSVAVFGSIVRLKNLVVHPDFRRRGIGRAAAARWAELAARHDRPAAACFVHFGGPAVAMYRQAGFRPVSKQTEWERTLRP